MIIKTSSLLDNLLTGVIDYNAYIPAQENMLKAYCGFNEQLVSTITEDFSICDEMVLAIDKTLTVTHKYVFPEADLKFYLLTVTGKNTEVDYVKKQLADQLDLTVGMIMDNKDYNKATPKKNSFKIPDRNILHIKIPSEMVLKPGETDVRKINTLNQKADEEINTGHLRFLQAYVRTYSDIMNSVQKVLYTNIDSIKETYKATNRLMQEMDKEYKKSLKLANTMLAAIREQKA